VFGVSLATTKITNLLFCF